MLGKTVKLIVISLVMSATLSGCNTARGFGEDVQHLGGAITRGASK
ncbi:entericidin A/B family lipoprotein [Sodalis sp. C49]